MANNQGKAAFNMAEVEGIRARYAQGETQGALAREFGVSVNTIARMVRGETYPQKPRMGVRQVRGAAVVNESDDVYIQRATSSLIANARALGLVHEEGEGQSTSQPDRDNQLGGEPKID